VDILLQRLAGGIPAAEIKDLTILLTRYIYIIMKIELTKIKCLRCGYEWYPRIPDVRRCPRCKSFYFDRERKRPKLNTGEKA